MDFESDSKVKFMPKGNCTDFEGVPVAGYRTKQERRCVRFCGRNLRTFHHSFAGTGSSLHGSIFGLLILISLV